MIKRFFPIIIALVITLILFAQDSRYRPVDKFDPARDPFKDLKETVAEAKKTNKRIILDIGGEWCIWCHRIDAYMEENKEVKDLLAKYYIIMKVNFSPENKNEKFLSGYPKVDGYPHFFILDQNGDLLHSQNTGELEKDKSYSKEKFITFLTEWKVAHNPR
jgi:thioredoxin-related protein